MRLAPSALRRPKHTGVNRCWPCTVTNLLVLAVGCLVLWVVTPVASVAVGVVGVAVVWLRGYLLPYTPQFAPRLVDRLPWDPFAVETGGRRPPKRAVADGDPPTDAPTEHRSTGQPPDQQSTDGRDRESRGPSPATLADATAADGEAILGALVSADVVTATGDDIQPTRAFEESWHDEIRALRDRSPEELAEATLAEAPAATAAHTVTDRDRTYVVLSDGTSDPSGEVWLRRPVAVAETAAARALAGTGLDPERRAVAAHGLALFLDECPVCGVELAEQPAGGCCGPPRTDAEGHPLQALVCTDCRAQFAVFD